MPLISVITPVLNGRRFLEECLQSVISQNCADCEHFILDGGSTDGTLDLIRSYADRYSHLRWVSGKDRGQSDAMNKGVCEAAGEVIGFLNADDYYEPGVLNRVRDIFLDLPEPALVVGNCNVRDAQHRLIEVNRPSNLRLESLLLGLAPHPSNPSAYFYHASLHNTVGLYDVEEDQAMDLDFLLSAVRYANVFYFDETWGNWRFYPGTKSFENDKAGRAGEIIPPIFAKHRQRLPRWRRSRLLLEEYLHRTVLRLWRRALEQRYCC